MRHQILFGGLILFMGLHGIRAKAQEPPRFAPPRPVFDSGGDFDDNDDDLDLDSPNRPPPLPPATQLAPPSTGGAPVSDFQPPTIAPSHGKDTGKIHFKIVEGQFYEKGKPRGRAPIRPDKSSSRQDQGVPDFGQDPQFQ